MIARIRQDIGELAFGRTFVDVMVPAADIGESNLHSEIGFDELRQLPQAVTEASLGIIGAGRGVYFPGSAPSTSSPRRNVSSPVPCSTLSEE
jgi:hypothetical protein